jgi:hypothetical protein
MLKGKVSPNAIGMYSPGSAFGAASFIAAGTAMYEALAASIAKINLLPISCVTRLLAKAITQPFKSRKPFGCNHSHFQ